MKNTHKMHNLAYDFTDKKVSPWGGVRLIHELYQKSNLKQICSEAPFHKPGSNRGFDPLEVVEGFMTSVILGAKRLSHSAILRHDEVIKEIFGWKKGMPSQSTLSRFFRKYDMEDNDRIFPALNRKWFEQFAIDKLTIDIDSTILTRYGTQDGVERGYNRTKHGRGSHHPILAFAAELQMVVNAWMRSGDSGAATDFNAFIDEMLHIIPKEKIGLIRADSGFYGRKHLQRIEDECLNYIVAVHMKAGLRAQIMQQTVWYPMVSDEDIGMEYCSFDWKAHNWTKARKFVIVRKDTDKRPNAGGKLLFPELEEFEKYRYVGFVTNLKLSSALIWQLYNKRADCENRIKELKYDYGIEGFCLTEMWATENAFRWVMVAHNLMALFKLKALSNRKHSPMLSTISFQCIAIGSYLSRSARKTVLKLSVSEKRRQFISRLFSKISDTSPPFEFSIE